MGKTLNNIVTPASRSTIKLLSGQYPLGTEAGVQNVSFSKRFKAWIPVFAGMTCLFFVCPLQAERRGDQGYGVMLGNPSGLSAKVWIDENVAFDGAVGVARGEFDIHADLLIHRFKWLHTTRPAWGSFQQAVDRNELPFYFGIGARLLFEEDKEFGIRLPLGLSYLRSGSPWEFFGEIAPVIRVTPDTGFNGDFAVGVRYYFQAIRPMGDK